MKNNISKLSFRKGGFAMSLLWFQLEDLKKPVSCNQCILVGFVSTNQIGDRTRKVTQ